MGTLQATEVIKQILGLGTGMAGRLMLYDALDNDMRMIRTPKNPACPLCGDNPTVTELIDYEEFCGVPANDHVADDSESDFDLQITPAEFEKIRDEVTLIDVRDPRNIKSYGHAAWGASEVWDAMWVPHYLSNGKMSRKKKTNIVYSIDLVRGLDVYIVSLPANAKLLSVSMSVPDSEPTGLWLAAAGALLLGVGGLHSAAGRRRRRTATV